MFLQTRRRGSLHLQGRPPETSFLQTQRQGSLRLQGRPPETSCLQTSSPALALCFIPHRRNEREVTPSPLCFSSQCGRPSAHSTTKRDNVNASIDHPCGIPFTLNNMPSSHIVFDVTRVLTYNLFIKCRLYYFVIYIT